MKTLIYGFRNMFVFKGRTTRKQYWIFHVWACLIPFIIGWIIPETWFQNIWFSRIEHFVIYWIFFIPCFSIAVRRLHDINRSAKLAVLFYASVGLYELWHMFFGVETLLNWVMLGYYFLYVLMLLFVGVILFILMLKKGNKYENQYGPSPYPNTEKSTNFEESVLLQEKPFEDKLEPIVRWIVLFPAILVIWKVAIYFTSFFYATLEYSATIFHRSVVPNWLSAFLALMFVASGGVTITSYFAKEIAPKFKIVVEWLCLIVCSLWLYYAVYCFCQDANLTIWRSILNYLAVTIGIGIAINYLLEDSAR